MNELLSFFSANTAVVIAWTEALIVALLAVIVFVGTRNTSPHIFSFAVLATSFWIFVMGIDLGITQTESSCVLSLLDFIPRLTYYTGSVIIMLLYYFMVTFPDGERIPWIEKSILITSLITLPLYFLTDLIVGGGTTEWIENTNIIGAEIWSWTTGPLNIAYTLFFNSIFLLGIAKLLKKAMFTTDLKIREQSLVTFWALFVGIVVPSLVNILLPMIGIYSYNWVGTITHIIWVTMISYSIIKHNNMSVRIVATEVLIVAAIFLLFISIFL